jgi:hypothetical protein
VTSDCLPQCGSHTRWAMADLMLAGWQSLGRRCRSPRAGAQGRTGQSPMGTRDLPVVPVGVPEAWRGMEGVQWLGETDPSQAVCRAEDRKRTHRQGLRPMAAACLACESGSSPHTRLLCLCGAGEEAGCGGRAARTILAVSTPRLRRLGVREQLRGSGGCVLLVTPRASSFPSALHWR